MKAFSTIKLGVPSANLTLIFILSEDVCMCSRPGVHCYSAAALHQVLRSPPPHPCQVSPSHSHFHTLLDFHHRNLCQEPYHCGEGLFWFPVSEDSVCSHLVHVWRLMGGEERKTEDWGPSLSFKAHFCPLHDLLIYFLRRTFV